MNMTQNCIVCGGKTSYSFSKTFNRLGLGTVDYFTCADCGFTYSKTHFEMTPDEWSGLNEAYHNSYHGTNVAADDKNWFKRLAVQAEVLSDLSAIEAIPFDEWIDYGCGDGKLADMLGDYGIHVEKYDKYLPETNTVNVLVGKYNVVINTSVLEHLRTTEEIDEIFSLVSNRGVMALHTFVSKVIEPNPEWFYLLPVHCAFHTYQSMTKLFERYGFSASAYHEQARLWVLFKNPPEEVLEEKYNYTNGSFVNYWG